MAWLEADRRLSETRRDEILLEMSEVKDSYVITVDNSYINGCLVNNHVHVEMSAFLI